MMDRFAIALSSRDFEETSRPLKQVTILLMADASSWWVD